MRKSGNLDGSVWYRTIGWKVVTRLSFSTGTCKSGEAELGFVGLCVSSPWCSGVLSRLQWFLLSLYFSFVCDLLRPVPVVFRGCHRRAWIQPVVRDHLGLAPRAPGPPKYFYLGLKLATELCKCFLGRTTYGTEF